MHVLSQEGPQRKVCWKKKYDKEKEEEKANVSEEMYHDKIFFGNDALACKNKTTDKEIEQTFVADSGYTSHMVNSLKNVKPMISKNSGQDRKQESDDGLASRQL